MKRFVARMLTAALGATGLAVTSAPSRALDYSLGGVSLQAYCVKAYGQNYKAVALGPNAGDWRCQNVRNSKDQLSISVQTACVQQYPNEARYVKAKIVNNSWVCSVTYPERPVDLQLYCKQKYGNGFEIALRGKTANDLYCLFPGSTAYRHVGKDSVLEACRQQWYSVEDAVPVGTDWQCLLKPQG